MPKLTKHTVITFDHDDLLEILTNSIKDKVNITNTKITLKEELFQNKIKNVNLIIEEL